MNSIFLFSICSCCLYILYQTFLTISTSTRDFLQNRFLIDDWSFRFLSIFFFDIELLLSILLLFYRYINANAIATKKIYTILFIFIFFFLFDNTIDNLKFSNAFDKNCKKFVLNRFEILLALYLFFSIFAINLFLFLSIYIIVNTLTKR